MSRDPFHSVYKFEGIYADPYDVINVIRSTPEERKQEVIDAVKKGGLHANPNVLREVQKFEHLRDMSS